MVGLGRDFPASRRLARGLLAGSLALAGIATGAGSTGGEVPAALPPSGAPWVSEFQRNHPLSGRIWQPSENRFIEPATVVEALKGASFILLGEKHDNVDHHRIQAWLLGELMASGRQPAVAFEMFTTEQEGRIAEHVAANPKDAAGIGEAVAWGRSGWPDWTMYQPVVQAALDGAAPILAASFSRGKVRSIVREGLGVLGEEERRALGVDEPIPSQHVPLMTEEIVESHCHQLPVDVVGAMVTAGQVKDALMAAVLVRGAGLPGRDGAVVIAGSGHVRADTGVPWHLRRMAPGRRVAAIGLIEVEGGKDDPAAYVVKVHGKFLPFEFVWFTPRVDEIDPCEKYAEELRQARERYEAGTAGDP